MFLLLTTYNGGIILLIKMFLLLTTYNGGIILLDKYKFPIKKPSIPITWDGRFRVATQIAVNNTATR
jgi:hypothetical protein